MPEVEPIPAGFSSVTPYLIVDDAPAALDLYKKIFAAEEVVRLTAAGGDAVIYSELRIGSSVVCVIDQQPDQKEQSPAKLGGVTGSLWLYVQDVDEVFSRAVDGGCEVMMPVADMFWGDRMGKLADPFGQVWAVATHTKDMTPEEISEAAASVTAE